MDLRPAPDAGFLSLLDDVPLADGYVPAARAANTLKGYRSDRSEWCSWCAREDLDPLAGEAAAISKYLVFLARCGRQGGDRGPAAGGPALRLPAPGPPGPDRGGSGGGRVEGHPPHPRRPARPGGAADTARAPRSPQGVPYNQSLAHAGQGARARPGRRPGQGLTAGGLRRRPAPLGAGGSRLRGTWPSTPRASS